MCGIFTWVSKDGLVDTDRARAALDLQLHRGPDHQALRFWSLNDSGKLEAIGDTEEGPRHGLNVALGTVRLSIVDLHERSNQPMQSQDGRYTISFNGEIYNYIEIREELKALGEEFRTRGDTEVLLKAWIRWGESCLHRLNGAWSFAVFDNEEGTVFFSKDRIGKKPLYYYHDSKTFIAASEIKSIFKVLGVQSRKLDPEHLKYFLVNNVWPATDTNTTLYQSISSVAAGHSLRFNTSAHTFQIEATSTLSDYLDEPASQSTLSDDIESAVNIRLRAEVPVAILLSGGVDSTAVAAYACLDEANKEKIAFYTGNTGFGGDLPYARLVASSLGVKLKEVDIQYGEGMLSRLRRMTYHYEVPVPVYGNTIAMESMFEAMSADGIKCVLDGTGGDELFGGNYTYGPGVINGLMARKDILGLAKFVALTASSKQISLGAQVKQMAEYANANWVHGALPITLGRRIASAVKDSAHMVRNRRKRPSQQNLAYFWAGLNQGATNVYLPGSAEIGKVKLLEMQVHDILKGTLPNWLFQTDQNAMMHGVEARSPLLDYRLIKYLNLKDSEKFNNGLNKFSLRKAIPAGMDTTVLSRRDKQGFRYSGPKLYADNATAIVSSIAGSQLLREFVDVDRLVGDARANNGNVNSYFMLRLLSVAMLEETYDCAV